MDETPASNPMMDETLLTEALDRIRETTIRTPVVPSPFLSEDVDADVYLKLENLQSTGSFKIRGATNFIAQLSGPAAAAGVVTASSGNHAQGVALAADTFGIDAKIVMPQSTPTTKVAATRSYGGTVVLDGEDYADATECARQIERSEDRTYVPTFDDWQVIAGQGTIGLEVLESVPACDLIVVPVGGGGLISGIAAAVEHRSPDTRIVGVQATGASTVARSLEKGRVHTLSNVDTVADGIAINNLGEKPFEVIRSHVDDVVTVSDGAIEDALYALLVRGKLLVEGAGAAPVAALCDGPIEPGTDDDVVAILSGGNIDSAVVAEVLGTRTPG